MSEKSISEIIKDSLRNQATKIVDPFLQESGIQGETKEVIVAKLVEKGLESFVPLAKEALGISLDISLGPIVSREAQFVLGLFIDVLDKKGGDFFSGCLEAFQDLTLDDTQKQKLLNQFTIAADSLKKDLSEISEKFSSIPDTIREVAKII